MNINIPSWSLSTEAFFYLSFPFVGVWFSRKSRNRPVLAFTIVWLLSLIVPLTYMWLRPDGRQSIDCMSQAFWLSVVKYNPLVRLPEFLMGIALARQYARMKSFPHAGQYAIGSALAVLLIAALAAAVPFPLLNNSLLSPVFAVLVLSLAFESASSRVLSSRPLLILGEASYSLYIIHEVVMPWTNSVVRHVLPFLGGALRIAFFQIAASVALSIVCYYSIEIPARRYFRKRFSGTEKSREMMVTDLVAESAATSD